MTTENKRDLAADLAICEAAAPAFTLHQGVYAVPTGGTTIETEICRDDYEPLTVSDTEFILEAREGWPEAIRRAMAAEAEVERLEAFIQHESECAIDAVQELERLRLACDYWRKEAKDANLLCAELEGECVGHIAVLERIANATMSQYATIDDMIRGIKRIAREALEHGTQENNGR